MGEVYRAWDSRLDRTVAIKISTRQFSERFEREARAVAALNHPHICTLYDIGPNYLVMEHIEGERLKGPLPVEEALRLAIQMAEALDAAHRKGIVHRDLKPSNVLVSKAGVKLLDFGLAKMRAPTVTEETLTQPITGEGTIVGTLQYMSPEQLQGKEADARSDIFAFGLTLYEMLTGRRAFEASSQASLIGAILHTEPPPVSSLVPVAPPALDRVVRQCLAKDPDNRWQSARDIAGELQWIAEADSQAGLPVPIAARRRSREGLAWLVAAALGIAAFGEGTDAASSRKSAAAAGRALPARSARGRGAVRFRAARVFAGWRQGYCCRRIGREDATLDTQPRFSGDAPPARYGGRQAGRVFA
jgi:serine/threonine protein kinase